MGESLPIVLVPGLNCSPRLYAAQIPRLWQFGPVTIADQTRDESMSGIAQRLLANAPPKFVLAGLSMGGYVAFEILRQAPERVAKLALLDTSARADTPEQTEKRLKSIELAQAGRFQEVLDGQFPLMVHHDHVGDQALRDAFVTMANDGGPRAFVNQQRAIMGRIDSRPHLAAIRCPTLVLVGDGDQLTPPALAREIAAGIAGSHLVTVPDCGHLSTIERPEAVTEAFGKWM
jgi:pimeloyl-ACP methyl ester carboxylesterase